MRETAAALLLLWIAMAVPELRAADGGFNAPPPPADLILDEARTFARDPERRQAIAESLARVDENHGFRLYFALYDTLFDRSLQDQAHELRVAWLGDAPGMVLVVEMDRRRFHLGRAAPAETEIEPGMRMPLAGPLELSQAEISGIVRGLEDSLRAAADREDFAEKLGVGMAEGVSAVLDARAAAPEGGTRTRMIVLAVGLLAATGLAALLVVAGLKRAEAKALERYSFPKVGVGIRLGAPYGGGKIRARNFRNREPRSEGPSGGGAGADGAAGSRKKGG